MRAEVVVPMHTGAYPVGCSALGGTLRTLGAV